ncbi:helix-turn-helix domain-containing protein [Cerasicoccus fimbriatus]|uniref:helix-turn-helix domain-containing protein n=1 Tax=Cerasicoccus fimbriatus TaxID=3014554 RepID=UPI0022B5C8B6|nr:helix-turn-helix domain-containing protein [Cerasicoccus sp. TK19100]
MLENLKIKPEYDGFIFLAESVRNPPALRAHHHVELEVNLVIDGEISYVVGGKRFTFKKRELLWLFPEQEHQLVDRSANAKYYVAVFKPQMIADACRGKRYAALKQQQLSEPGIAHTRLAPEAFDLIRHSMHAATEDGIDPDILNRELGYGAGSNFQFHHRDPDWLNASLRNLLLLCWRNQQSETAPGRETHIHPAVQRALEIMSEEATPDELPELAAQCGVSASYLSRKFREQIGVPLTRYRNSVRLSRFWEAYHRPQNQSVLEAVFAAGFGSYAQFYRIFTEAYGAGPREVI